jgi:hypothetical protein
MLEAVRERKVIKAGWYCTAKGMEQVLRERGLLFVPGMTTDGNCNSHQTEAEGVQG